MKRPTVYKPCPYCAERMPIGDESDEERICDACAVEGSAYLDDAATFQSDVGGSCVASVEWIDGERVWFMQFDNGEPYNGLRAKGGLRIYFQGPARRFNAFANTFVDGYELAAKVKTVLEVK